jgi:plasmid stabilization system protein ParE
MTARFVLAPQAANDLAQIWRYIKKAGGPVNTFSQAKKS